MKFKKVSGAWNPANQKEIAGKILNIKEEGGKYKTKVYTLETEKEILDVFGSAVLDPKLEPIANVGNIVKIVFLGKKQGKDSEYKDFDVYLGNNSGGN